MAITVDIALAGVSGVATTGGSIPIPDPVPVDTDVITSGASQAQSDFSVPAGSSGLCWIITVTGGNVRVLFGDNPVATAAEGGGWLILSGQTREFVARAGHKASVITAEV